jgi:hypothetical protein
MPYDLRVYFHPKLSRDCHVDVAEALYSVPHRLVGVYTDARADSRLYYGGQVVKVHIPGPIKPRRCETRS